MAAGSSLKYHAEMVDSRGELYELLAEAQTMLQALRLQGVISVPAGVRQSVDRSEVGAEPDGGAFAASPPGRPSVARPASAVAAGSNVRPTLAMPPRAISSGAISSTAAAIRPQSVAPTPVRPPTQVRPPTPVRSSIAPPAESAPAPAGGLLGQWGARLIPNSERLARVVAELGPMCEACGQPTLTGKGGLNSNLVLLASPADGEAGAMLANMLVKVVLIEPADAWWVHPRVCKTCADAVARQVAAIRPRVVLALGSAAGAMIGEAKLGEWTRYGQADAVYTWHPDEILTDAGRKRVVFGHLQEVARRR